KVCREETVPLAARLEDPLRDFADGALAARHIRDDARRRLDLGHRIGDGARERHTREHREVREVVTDERALVPREPAAAQQRFERRGLAGRGILDQLVHRQLARPQRRGGRFPSREPHHEEPRRAQQADAEAVLDVKTLEFDRVIADDAQVEAVIGEHAVDVEADELEAAGESRIEHGHFFARARGTARARSSTAAPPPPWDLGLAAPLARAVCHTYNATVTIPASWSSGIMFAPSEGACSGSGWVSRKNPSAPAAAAAYRRGGMNSRRPPLAPSGPWPGCCTEWVASYTTGTRHAARSRAKLRMSTTRSPYPKKVPRSVTATSGAPPAPTLSTAPPLPSADIHCPFFTFTARPPRPAAT